MKEQEISKIYWKMDEIVEMFSTTHATIHNWCVWFKLSPRRNRRNDRMFTRGDIYSLQCIHILLRIEGMTVKGAQREMQVL